MSETMSESARGRLRTYLDPSHPLRSKLCGFEVLERDLAESGKVACVRAGLAAALAVQECWAWEASAATLDATLDATWDWLAAPSAPAARRAHHTSSRLLPLCRAVYDQADRHAAAKVGGPASDLPPWEDMRSCDVGTAAFAAARAAHARTVETAAKHATAAVAAAMQVVELELGTGCEDHCACSRGEPEALTGGQHRAGSPRAGLDVAASVAHEGVAAGGGDADPGNAVLVFAILAALDGFDALDARYGRRRER